MTGDAGFMVCSFNAVRIVAAHGRSYWASIIAHIVLAKGRRANNCAYSGPARKCAVPSASSRNVAVSSPRRIFSS